MASLVSIMANTFEGKIEGVYNNVDYNVTSNPPPTTTTSHLDISIGLFRGDIPSKSSRGTPGPLALWSIPGEHHQASRCVESTKVPKGTKGTKKEQKVHQAPALVDEPLSVLPVVDHRSNDSTSTGIQCTAKD